MAEENNLLFHRMELIVGRQGLNALKRTNVIIFGIGGVGSWAAESLIRSGIGHLTIVDSDKICITNINRQIQATTESVGLPKVGVLKERLLLINPAADIDARDIRYDKTTAEEFNLNQYDYVIDAIDTLSCKIELILNTLNADTTLFSAMGAARRLDPTRIKVADIWQTRGCRLGHFVRKRLRKRNKKAKFQCVYSDELMPLRDEFENSGKDQPNGSAAHITGIFGFHLCGLVIKDVIRPFKDIRPLS